jgi:hypothetical protein
MQTETQTKKHQDDDGKDTQIAALMDELALLKKKQEDF